MTSANVAFVTGTVVKWAVGRSGLSRTELANKLGITVDELELWERGKVQPSFTKAEQLADFCHIPFGYLFLPKPPASDLPLPDLRTKQNRRVRTPSVAFTEVLSDVLVKQEWYKEHLEESGHKKKLPFVGKFTLKDDVETVAKEIRGELYIGSGLRWQAGSWAEYLNLLSKNAEDTGILVMRSGVVGNDTTRPLAPEEFQGFSISDDIAPVVFLNSADFKTAQIFTLIHELTHIWIGKSAIDNPDPVDMETQHNNIEGFCNDVAAEVLIPRKEFVHAWPTKPSDATLQKIAENFWVSTLVVLRRAYELKVITHNEFVSLRERERRSQTQKGRTGGDYYRNVMTRHGQLFTAAVLADASSGMLVFRDAASLLAMKVPTLMKMIEIHK